MSAVYVDASAWVAIKDAADPDHDAAQARWRELVDAGVRLYSTDRVIERTFETLLVRTGRDTAEEFVTRAWASPRLTIVAVDRDLADAAWELALGHRDGGACGAGRSPAGRDARLDFVDATSVAAMRALDIPEAFGFGADLEALAARDEEEAGCRT